MEIKSCQSSKIVVNCLLLTVKLRMNSQKDVLKVGFLKTHKCASSSVQNILIRWGLTRDSNFVLPHTGNYLKGGAGQREG